MSSEQVSRPPERWARFRFSIVGPLLAAPATRGELQAELKGLSEKLWRHPITGEPVRFGLSTIQRWYYTALAERTDPVGALRRKPRRDRGQTVALNEPLRQTLRAQYDSHPSWSYQLHRDNLAVLVEEHPELGPMPSYASVRRFMKRSGLIKKRRRRGAEKHGAPQQAEERFEHREVRSFEAEYTNSLWHLDFHHGSLKVLTPKGEWVTPRLLAMLDDYSRLICHAQWYLGETTEELVHGLAQSFLKRGLPRALMTDNGSAMVAAETRQGLLRLGIHHRTTLPYSPYQNAKQEVFWAQVEGRLMSMLENYTELNLSFLNEATQAWVELEYQRAFHSEIAQSPLERFLQGPSVARDCPNMQELRFAFGQETSRLQRFSDGTLTLEGIRFELPSRFRHFQRIYLRYASWDFTHVYLIDERTGDCITRIYPLDKTNNADGRRRTLENKPPPDNNSPPQPEVAPLLNKLIEQYRQTGLPPAYLPITNLKSQEDS